LTSIKSHIFKANNSLYHKLLSIVSQPNSLSNSISTTENY